MPPCLTSSHRQAHHRVAHLRLSFSVLLQLWIRLLDCVSGSRTAHYLHHRAAHKCKSKSDECPMGQWCGSSDSVPDRVDPRLTPTSSPCDLHPRRSVMSHSIGTRANRSYLVCEQPPPSCLLVSLYRTLSSASHLLLLLLLLSPQRCLCRSAHHFESPHHTSHAHHSHHHTHHNSHSHPHSHPHHPSSDHSIQSSAHTISSLDDSPQSEALFLQHQSYLDQTHTQSDLPTSSSYFVSHDVLRPRRPPELSQTKCVERCSCKWRSGKMWVECQDAGLQHVPRGLDSGTQVLVLSGNPLSELEARAFERVDLRNLQRLHMVNCRLHEINVDALQQLSNLIELDLAQNELTTLPSPALMHTPILRKLSLARNKIRAIKNEPFAKLKHLQSIDLSGNGIELVDANAFYGVKDLKHLYLHENKLRSIDGKTMADLPSVLELTLQHNPWRCDCGLRAFRDWMMQRDISISYSPNCSSPTRLAGKAWSALDLDEFACPPDVVRVDTEVVVYEGENASIGCVMAAIPNVHIEWEWRGRTIRNMSLMTFGRQMYLIRESSSPAGHLDVELLPTGGPVPIDDLHQTDSSNSFDLGELVLNEQKSVPSVLSEQHKQTLLNSMIDANGAKHRAISSIPVEPETFQSSARAESNPVWRLAREKRSTTAFNDETYKRTSTLYIMNALEKDSGSYICIGSNKAGTVSANVTLTVLRRLEVTAAAYSGEEVAGIVLGALFVFLLTFVAICFVVLKSKNGLARRATGTSTSATGGSNHHQSNGTSQTGLHAQTVLNGGTTVTPATNMNGLNGRIGNGNVQMSPSAMCNGGTAVRRLSNTSTDTKDSKVSSSNLLISSSGSASNSTTNTNTGSMCRSYVGLVPNGTKGAPITIRTNQLAEQIEMANYGQTPKQHLDTLNQAEPVQYGHCSPVHSGSFTKLMLDPPLHGHYPHLEEHDHFDSMLNDNVVLNSSPYGGNFANRHYPNGTNPIGSTPNHHQARHYGNGLNSHYPSLVSNLGGTLPSVDHYPAHPSCSGSDSVKLSPSMQYGNVVIPSAGSTTALKSLSSLASSNCANNIAKPNCDYFGGGLDYYNSGLMYPSMGQSADYIKLSTSATLQSHDPVDEFNKRRAAASVAEELQQRIAAAGVVNHCSDSTKMTKATVHCEQPSSGQVVQFANSATVYSYSPSGPVSITAKQASPALNRIRNGANGPMVAIARDSPDEGLGEETDVLE